VSIQTLSNKFAFRNTHRSKLNTVFPLKHKMVILSIDPNSTQMTTSKSEYSEMASSASSGYSDHQSRSFSENQSRSSSRRSSSSTFISFSSSPLTADQSIQTSHSHLLEHGRRIQVSVELRVFGRN
jgi:hypothetical protein